MSLDVIPFQSSHVAGFEFLNNTQAPLPSNDLSPFSQCLECSRHLPCTYLCNHACQMVTCDSERGRCHLPRLWSVPTACHMPHPWSVLSVFGLILLSPVSPQLVQMRITGRCLHQPLGACHPSLIRLQKSQKCSDNIPSGFDSWRRTPTRIDWW